MGIDDLPKRAAEAYAQGARFAKWRNVLQIDPETGLPSDLAIEICVQNLAQYASICQAAGLVPSTRPPRASYPPTASLHCAPAPPARPLAPQLPARRDTAPRALPPQNPSAPESAACAPHAPRIGGASGHARA
jgi:hypothetical protein